MDICFGPLYHVWTHNQFAKDYVKDSYNKEFFIIKSWNDSYLLTTLKKNSKLKSCGIWKFKKFKVCYEIKKFQESFITCKRGVMYGCSHNPTSQKGCQNTKKNNQNWIHIYVLPFKAMVVITSFCF